MEQALEIKPNTAAKRVQHSASWPPLTKTRLYVDYNSKEISHERMGKDLPSSLLLQAIDRSISESDYEKMLNSVKLFTNLPAEFFKAYLLIQHSNSFLDLPKVFENKNISVRGCIKKQKHPAFLEGGDLHPAKWETLGWPSQVAYEQWLDTSMLFAFSHCTHYCSAPRVFEVQENPDPNDNRAYFKQVVQSHQDLLTAKRTNILSVNGFEYRGYQGNESETLEDVKAHSKLTMQQILKVAELTDTTDIVLIPYGMGVFISGTKSPKIIKEYTIEGMCQALTEYAGPPVTLHCCGRLDFFLTLSAVRNPRISIVNKMGYDAYVVANDIQDRGDDDQEKEMIPAGVEYKPRPLKSMLINAADNDWTAMLEPKKGPGQFCNGHTLYHSTSDEYYALVMFFSYFSIKRLKFWLEEKLAEKITQILFDDVKVMEDPQPQPVLLEEEEENARGSQNNEATAQLLPVKEAIKESKPLKAKRTGDIGLSLFLNPSLWGMLTLLVLSLGLLCQFVSATAAAAIFGVTWTIFGGIYIASLIVSIGRYVFSRTDTTLAEGSGRTSEFWRNADVFILGLLGGIGLIATIILSSVGTTSFLEFAGHFFLAGLQSFGFDITWVTSESEMICGIVLLLLASLVLISMALERSIALHTNEDSYPQIDEKSTEGEDCMPLEYSIAPHANEDLQIDEKKSTEGENFGDDSPNFGVILEKSDDSDKSDASVEETNKSGLW